MKAKLNLLAIFSGVALLCWTNLPISNAYAGSAVGDHDRERSELTLREQETIRKSFPAHKILDVDNVFGSIEVVGGQSDQVQLVVTKTLRAESQAKMDAAKKEVTLDVSEEADLLKLYVNGPFRCNCGDGCNGNGWRHGPGYEVTMDFQLQVPRNIELELRTVNSGHINVRGVNGSFSVHNVNGAIDLEDVGGGKATAHTVNGGVKVVFRENPKENSGFTTINGRIELYFARGLSADFRFKNMNGGVFSDFPMTSLPPQSVNAERQDGKFVYRADRFTGGRVGSGGPEIKAENMNGDIRVLERQ